jgi:hypothetical protein
MTQLNREVDVIEIRSLHDVWIKWSRRYGRALMDRIGLIIGLFSYHLYRLNEMIHWW